MYETTKGKGFTDVQLLIYIMTKEKKAAVPQGKSREVLKMLKIFDSNPSEEKTVSEEVLSRPNPLPLSKKD